MRSPLLDVPPVLTHGTPQRAPLFPAGPLFLAGPLFPAGPVSG
jgi:hypothetical protein